MGPDIRPFWMQDTPEKQHERVVQYMEAAETEGCRRVVLDAYLDGHTRVRCENDEVRCDGCDAEWEVQESLIPDEESSPARSDPCGPALPISPGVASTVVEAATGSPIPGMREGSEAASDADSFITQAPAYIVDTSRPDPGYAVAGQSTTRGPSPREGAVVPPRRRSGHDVVPTHEGAARSAQPRQHIPTAIRHEFRRQDIERAELSQYRHREAHESAREEGFLLQEVRQWVERCWTCAQAGRDDGHELFRCYQVDNREAREWMFQSRKRMNYPGYVAHYHCGMPQSICKRADPKMRDDAAAKDECEAMRTGLVPTFAMMLFSDMAHQGIREAWDKRLQHAGVDSQEPEQVFRWLARQAEGVPMKQSQLVQEFIWCRRMYQGHEED